MRRVAKGKEFSVFVRYILIICIFTYKKITNTFFLNFLVERGVVVMEWDLGSGRNIISVDDVYVNDDERHEVSLSI